MLDEEGRRAARAVAGDFGRAAIGVVELDGSVHFRVGRHQQPAVRAHAGVAVADGAGDSSVTVRGRVALPGQQKIVLGAVRLGERDLH
jgi:hypothetical protein